MKRDDEGRRNPDVDNDNKCTGGANKNNDGLVL